MNNVMTARPAAADRFQRMFTIDTHPMATCVWCSTKLIDYSPDCEVEHGAATAVFARSAGLFSYENKMNSHLAGIARYMRDWQFVVDLGCGNRRVTPADLRALSLFDVVNKHLGMAGWTATLRLHSTGATINVISNNGIQPVFEIVGTPCW